MALLVILGTINFVLVKEMYSAYGEKYAFFVNQGVNFLYCIYGGAVLYPRMWFSNDITSEMYAASKLRFLAMGTLDAFGTFFTAMGAVYTPGSLQPILNQMLIPFTICISIVYLRKRFNPAELSGASLITFGACLSALPAVLAHHDDDSVRWYAVALYLVSNFPMAASSCYKQKHFREQEFDVWYLTQWVSIFQFLISFAFIPILCLPGFGGVNGTPLSDVPAQLSGGWHCYMEWSDDCRGRQTFLLLNLYCFVNVIYNTLGLYLTKVGSALLNAISYALLLPNTTLLFFTPLVGPVQEPLTVYSYFTVVGLIVVVIGFAFYQHYDLGVGRSRSATDDGDPIDDIMVMSKQPTFQERVIGLDTAHGSSDDFGLKEVLISRQVSWP
jgi:drug/metabolite transporter (DMT)-like permease